jgi:hypothetical protein
MPFQVPPRLLSALASALAAGLMLTIASCGHLAPLGPDPAATMPQPHQLRSPFVLQAMLVRQPTPAGACPAGYVTLPGANPGTCYRKTGTPVTFTSAAASPVSPQPANAPVSPQPANTPVAVVPGPTVYAFTITLPAADVPALTAVTTTAADAKGAMTISIAGKTWALPIVEQPFTSQQLPIPLPSRSQALQLQRLLVASA